MSILTHPSAALKSLGSHAEGALSGDLHAVEEWWSGKNAPSLNGPRLAAAGPTVNYAGDTHNHTYNITQQQGQSPHELAWEIHKLSQQNNRRGVSLADGAD